MSIDSRTDTEQSATTAAAKTPVATPPVVVAGAVCALLLVAAGAVGIRDALVAMGALDGTMWTKQAASWGDGLQPRFWMLVLGVALVLIGSWCVLLALKPRRRTHVQLTSDNAIWMRPRDLARLASDTAQSVATTVQASSAATRRSVTVDVETTAADTAEVEQQISQRLARRFSALADSPKVKVRAKQSGARS